jgi:pimeloyl-ACP methyl ester carboxylesterase
MSHLAYDDHGAGTPVVLLHGLTFDRTTWRPVIERLGDGLRAVAIDLPGHGETGGEPCRLDEVAERVHALLGELEIERPVVVGHSVSGAIAGIYAGTYTALGVVNVDQPLDVRPFAQLVRRLEPALRGPGFAEAFEPIQASMEIWRVPEPERSHLLTIQDIRAELVLGYWAELLESDPDELQARIEATTAGASRAGIAYLGVFGRELASADRAYLRAHISALQLEEWPEHGHLPHLVEPDRFAARVRRFVDECGPAQAPASGRRVMTTLPMTS